MARTLTNKSPIDNPPAGDRTGIYLWLMGALALLLRLMGIASRPFYVDEAVTLFISSRPLKEILPFMMQINEVHPPAYFWFVRLWLSLGESLRGGGFIGFMRLSSVLFGAGSIILSYLLAKRLYDEKTALLTALFLSFSSFHLFYCQELRMYPFLLFLILASFLLFMEMLKKPTVAAGAALFAVNGLMLLTHYFALFALIAQLVFGIFVLFCIYGKNRTPPPDDASDLARTVTDLAKDRQKAAPILKITALVSVLSAIPFLIWLPFFLKQTHHQDFTLRQNPGPTMALELISRMFYGETIDQPLWWGVNFFILAGLVPALLILYAFFKDRGPGPFMALAFPATTAFFVVMAGFTRFHIFEFKYFFIVLPFLIILAVRGIQKLKGGFAKTLLITLFLLVNGFTIYNYLYNPFHMGQNWRGAASFVASRSKPGDLLIVHPSMMSLPFIYEYKGSLKVIPMDTPDPRIGPILSSGKPLWIVSTVNHPFVRKAGLIPLFMHHMDGERVILYESCNKANEIGVYYFRPRQKEMDNNGRNSKESETNKSP